MDIITTIPVAMGREALVTVSEATNNETDECVNINSTVTNPVSNKLTGIIDSCDANFCMNKPPHLTGMVSLIDVNVVASCLGLSYTCHK